MRHFIFQFCGLILAGILTACSGGGGDDNITPPLGGAGGPSQGRAVVGAAGGTVSGPAGVQIVIPPGALAADVTIQIEQSWDGAPALPTSVTTAGPMFALTPHGLQFALPVTLTVPFDPAAVPTGSIPALYKTNATQTAWESVAGATVNGATISGQINGFSFVTAVASPLASSDPFPPHRIWEFVGHDASDQELSLDHGEVFEGVLFEQIEFGSLIIAPSGNDNIARGQVFANESGMT
ncbi:MAG: Immunoglobulin I-set domain-containing protein, partial [Gammaproteobacteria bacterium]